MAERPTLSPRQRGAIDAKERSHDALHEAQRKLQRGLALAQAGREADWAGSLAPLLEEAREALRRHRDEMHARHGLYTEILDEAPWLVRRVDRLDRRLRSVEHGVADLALEVERVRTRGAEGTGDLRQQAERVLGELRDLMASENDLVYERFEETPGID